MSSLSSKMFSKTHRRRPDYMQYNRAQLMRQQHTGAEIIIGPPVKPVAPPRPVVPTVTIENIHVMASNKNTADNDDDDDTKKNDHQTHSQEESKEELYVPTPNEKLVQVRHKHHWFSLKFEHDQHFYEFLDEFQIFGFLAEENGCLIVTNYQDLLGQSTKYRTVRFAEFDRWMPASSEQSGADYKKFYNEQNSIKLRGAVSKTEKTIGIRHNYRWLQLTFRYKWEFDKFLYDSKCYAFVDEHSSLIIREYKDLQTSDYRLMDVSDWDAYNSADADGSYSGSTVVVQDTKRRNTNTKKNKRFDFSYSSKTKDAEK
eukprot:CAMPEP_0202733564 /NCGR_PEP_ID=MMETSP1385-20130828/188233_1 /ASSEMBLY_ACC=CAM_ASM_000861 /TAXON_ID=933848 /ORGANISM="Elphidium margaritaceum" /LENGTH=313 /DNA_ID=CAMNT_0049399901 /DNA_START=31 /DNA_END=972 /DNA_ORIENTATION=+